MLILVNKFDIKWFEKPIDLRFEKINREEAANIVAVSRDLGNFRCDIMNTGWLCILTIQLETYLPCGALMSSGITSKDTLLVAHYCDGDPNNSILPYKDISIEFYLVKVNHAEVMQ